MLIGSHSPRRLGWRDSAAELRAAFVHAVCEGTARFAAIVLLASGLVLTEPGVAAATWQEPVAGAGQVSDIGSSPVMASINGVPYAAWSEPHGTNQEIFVGRLDPTGTIWEKVGGPVNFDRSASAINPALSSIGGVPYVGWVEYSGTKTEVRVARLNAARTGWEEPWRGVDSTHGGINADSAQSVEDVSLASVGDVPYVGWDEDNGSHSVARVARLDPSTQPFPTWSQPWAGVTATSGGIQASPTATGVSPAVTSIAGTPYVVWRESSGPRFQLRVARLNPGNNTWEEPWSGVSAISGGINDPTHDTLLLTEARPSLASINNFPYVAWTDYDGAATNARVARLDTSTYPAPTWRQEAVGVTASDGRINQSPTNYVASVSLASVTAGRFGVAVPYLAWVEITGGVFELRAARYDAATRVWQQPWPGVTQTFGAIGETPVTSERFPSLASVGGVPYVARQLYPTGGIRISRLEPELTSESAASATGGEIFSVTAHTYGVPYPIGFQYGPALGAQTAAQPAPAGGDTVTVTRRVSSLIPVTTYEYRPFATAGAAAPLVFGPTLTFRTDAAGGGTSTGSGSASATVATVVQIRVSPAVFPSAPSGQSVRPARPRTYGTRVSYILDRAGTVRFTVTRRAAGRRASHGRCLQPTRRNRTGRRCTRLVTLGGGFTRAGKAGANAFRFTGRLAGNRLKAGHFELLAIPFAGSIKGRSASAAFRIIP